MKRNVVWFTNFWKEKFRRIFNGVASYSYTLSVHLECLHIIFRFPSISLSLCRSIGRSVVVIVYLIIRSGEVAAVTTNHTELLRSECHTRHRRRHLAMNKCGFYIARLDNGVPSV